MIIRCKIGNHMQVERGINRLVTCPSFYPSAVRLLVTRYTDSRRETKHSAENFRTFQKPGSSHKSSVLNRATISATTVEQSLSPRLVMF